MSVHLSNALSAVPASSRSQASAPCPPLHLRGLHTSPPLSLPPSPGLGPLEPFPTFFSPSPKPGSGFPVGVW